VINTKEIYWLVELSDKWVALTSTELKEMYDKGLCDVQVWRLVHGRQPESRFLRPDGMIMDIFGNMEVL